MDDPDGRTRIQEALDAMQGEYRAIKPDLIERLTNLLEEWDFDDASTALRRIEHDLNDGCDCSVCEEVSDLRSRYG